MDCQAGLKRLWNEDRWALAVLGVAAIVATVAWGGSTRPMGDSESYRVAGRVIAGGWQQLTDRTPGYPLLLWLTGSLDSETSLLFVTQLIFHCLSVAMLLVIARSIGLPKMARFTMVCLLVTPPVMVKVVYTGTEALTEFLVVISLWLFIRWLDSRSGRALVLLGVVLGALAWVRPTFQLVWLPTSIVVWFIVARGWGRQRKSTSPRPIRAAVTMAVPAMLIVGSLVFSNGIRFQQWGMTPMLGWFLGSKTSSFVQDLPESEPLRTMLVKERDRRLLLGAETDAENYQFGIRDRIAEATGLEGGDLDRRMLDLNVGLITANPLKYVNSVNQSLFNLTQMDAEPAASGPGQIGGWLQSSAHFILMVGFALTMVTLPGLALAGYLERRTLAILGFCVMMATYVAVVSALVETGSPRLRAPTDGLIVLFIVTGWVMLAKIRWPADRLER